MFCKRTDYALILMVTLAQCYGTSSMSVREVAQQHRLSVTPFKGAVERLEKSGFLVREENEKLSLKIAPEEITIWQVVACVSEEEPLQRGNDLPRHRETSTITMINKEQEMLQQIVSDRLKRHKLSAWSKKASSTVYI